MPGNRRNTALGVAAACAIAAAVDLPAEARAQTDDADGWPLLSVCADVETEGRCTPIFACVDPAGGANAEPFFGRAVEDAFTVGGGSIEGALASGAECLGRWRSLPDGRGLAEGDCDDGRTFEIEYGFRHPDTGTLVGRGRTNRGEIVHGWADGDIRRFFQDRLGSPDGALPCGARRYPVS